MQYDPEQITPSGFRGVLANIRDKNILPFYGCELLYSDDIWDFSPYKKTNVPDTKMKIKFNGTPDGYIDDLKAYAIIEIARGNKKIQSISEAVKRIRLFSQVLSNHGYFSFETVSLQGFQELLSSRFDNSITAFYAQKAAWFDFVEICSTFVWNHSVDSDILSWLSENNNTKRALVKEKHKLPDIPKEYFDELLDSALKVCNSDNEEDISYHGIANLLIILSQTGLRIGEVCALKKDCLSNIMVAEKQSFFLTYPTWKRETGTRIYKECRIFVTDVAREAIERLLNEFREDRDTIGTDYLYVDKEITESLDRYPIQPDIASKRLKKLYYHMGCNYMQTINLPDDVYPELSRSLAVSVFGISKKYLNKTIVHPVTEQYRVHVCTELYRKGVSMEYIQEFMGHLSKQMLGYYIRPKENVQESPEFAHKIIAQIVKGEVEPLGGDGKLMESIEKFIKDNHFNIFTDLDNVVESLAKKVPIRQKVGGVCIQNRLVECRKDSVTSEFYCAYNVCPNIYHFYYMAHITYKQAKDLEKSSSLNSLNGFVRQAEKELNMLRTLSKEKLIPELESLKRYLEKTSESVILREYPELTEIVAHYDSILEEARKWTMIK